MSDTNPPNAKILAGNSGLGVPSPEQVDARALELAKMDGRSDANEADVRAARAELLRRDEPEQSPEVDERTEDLMTWDEPVGSTGTRAPKVGPDDEFAGVQDLVEEGIEEADHDQRLTASDEQDARDAV